MPDQVRHWAAAALAAAALAATASPAFAGGFMVDEQSVRGMGRAYAGEVADQGAASLFWNPAAIARSGGEVLVGGHARDTSSALIDSGSTITRPIPPNGLTTPVGGAAHLSDPVAADFAPNGAFVAPIGDRLALGVSFSEPFALDTQLGTGSWARYDTVLAEIETREIAAAVAVKLNERLDVGFAAQAQHMDARLQIALPNLSPLLPDGLTSVDGKGWDYGWAVGAQARARNLTFGIGYRSRMKRDLNGTFAVSGLQAPLDSGNFSAPSHLKLKTPSSLSAGVRWQVTPRLTLDAQATRHGWGVYDTISIVAGGQTTLVPQNYGDTTSLAFGGDFAASRAFIVRAGVQYDETPTPADLREAGVPDSDRWMVAAGASFSPNPRVTIDAAVSHSFFRDTNVFHDVLNYAGTPAATMARVRGSIDRSATVISGALRFSY